MDITPLKRLLFERQMTITALAEQSGVSYANLSLVVAGKRVPTLENALRIARALDTTIEELWGYVIES